MARPGPREVEPITDPAFVSAALVDEAGRIEEIDGASGRRALEDHPILANYARALVRSDRRRASFFWQRPNAAWLQVSIERPPTRPASALVTLGEQSLPHGLTARELDVVTLVAGGLNNREIADALRTSVRTVATHVEHVLAKLAQRSRAGVSALAAEQGLLRLPIPGDGVELGGLTVGILGRRSDTVTTGSAVRMLSPHRPLTRRPLLVGSALPLSGPARGDGIQMRNGAALAIDEINARGGVAGRRIEHVVVPTDIFDATSVRASFDALMAAEVDAITSLYVFCEDDAMERAAAYGAPYLHAMTSEHMAQRTGEDPDRYGRIFQVCPSEVHYGRGFVRFIDDLAASGSWRPHRRSVLFVETRLQSSQMATADTLETAAQSGWAIAGIHHVAAQDADWSGVLEVVRATDPAAILVTDFMPTELAAFQRAFASRPTDALVFAIYSPSVPAFLEDAGAAAEGVVWSTVTGTYGDGVGRGFMGRYAQRHGNPPGRSHAGIAYDEIHLLAQAWSAVDNPRDFRRVAERLRRQTYRGVNGSYHLDSDQQSALAYPDMTEDPSLSQAHLVLQVQDGEHRVLSPDPYVEASFRTPPWFSAHRASA
jgi:branched-chain amino acid transport system substrate-binding protein